MDRTPAPAQDQLTPLGSGAWPENLKDPAPGAARPTRARRAGRTGLHRPSVRLLVSGGFVNAGLATSTVFVSLFFYLASGSITGMVLYAIGRYLGLMVMSVGVVGVAPGASPRRLFRIGLVGTAAFYCLLIGLGRAVGPLALPLGLLNGAAAGVYWFGNNTLVYDVVRPVERGHYYGLSFSVMNVLSVAMPLLAGAVIAHIGGETGYAAVFGVALASFAAAWWTARGLGGTHGVGGVSIRQALALPVRRRTWGRMWTVVALRGFKQAAGGLGLIVLVELATHSAQAQGEYAAISALAAVATSVVAGRLSRRWRGPGMWLGAFGFLAATGLLVGHLDLGVLLLYGFASAFLYPGLMVPVASIVLEAIDDDPLAATRRGGYILSRELAANTGRLAAVGLLLVLLAVAPGTTAVLGLLIITGLLQLVAAHLAGTCPARRTLATT